MNRRKQTRLLVAVGLLVLLLVGAFFVSQSPVVAPQGPAGQPPAGSSVETSSVGQSGEGQAVDAASGLRWVNLSALPREARDTMKAIQAGPPYPYSRDGAVFGNRERLLPKQASGYYREFTVKTPGESDRGARRIVTGGPNNGLANREFYYTGDHYQTFERIRS